MEGRTVRQLCVRIAIVCVLCSAAGARAEDIPAFVKAYGQPAIAFGSDLYGQSPIAVDRDRIYIGGPGEIGLFTRDGDWLTFWPFSSEVRGLGTSPYPGLAEPSQVADLATSAWGTIYALDRTYAAVHRYASEGTFLGGWGGRGDGPGQFPPQDYPLALCAASDAVYVLTDSTTASGGLVTYRGRISKFTPEGQLLQVWDTPAADYPRSCHPLDIAPAADGGVWLLNATEVDSGDVIYLEETRIHRYGPGGNEIANWATSSDAARIGAEDEEWGYTWILLRHPVERGLRSYTADGTRQDDFQVDSPWLDDFAVSTSGGGDGGYGELFVLACEDLPKPPGSYGSAVARRIDVYSRHGVPVSVTGDYYDMLARGALIDPPSFAVTPQGDAYAKIDDLRADLNYVTHFIPNGLVAEVLRTNDWPVYNPPSRDVELVSRHYAAADAAGNYYTVEAVPANAADGASQWTLTLSKYSPSEAPLATYELRGPVTPTNATAFLDEKAKPPAALGPDGNLRVALMVGNRYPGNGNTFGTLWVGTVSTNGELLSSWSDESFGPWEVNALAVDPAGNLYLAGEGAWKYSPDGKRIGCIGGWGGTGDQRDAPGSLVNCAAAVDIDATGHLRVLDSLPHYSPTGAPVMAANHLLMFAYTQSSFTDVPYWHWAKDAIGSLTKAGLAAGYPDGTYHPAEALTRDQMAVYISRALAGGDDKVPAFTGAPSFSDVGADNWALKYVQ